MFDEMGIIKKFWGQEMVWCPLLNICFAIVFWKKFWEGLGITIWRVKFWPETYFCKYGYDGVSSIKPIGEWIELEFIDDR